MIASDTLVFQSMQTAKASTEETSEGLTPLHMKPRQVHTVRPWQ